MAPASEQLPLQTKGIFRNLPTFPAELKDLTAIVTGANGISGFHTMRVLLESPQRWKKVWAASRRPPPEEMMALLSEEQRARVEHVACDFLSKPGEIASQLREKGVAADYVFFYSYAQPRPKPGAGAWSNAQELAETNYYPQEDALYKYCEDHSGTDWNIICPAWIIGAVNNAAMNALHPLAVYAAVQAHKGEPLNYPGDYTAWVAVTEHSSAMLTGYLSEWAVLGEKTKNQKFVALSCRVGKASAVFYLREAEQCHGSEAGSQQRWLGEDELDLTFCREQNASDTCPLPNNRLFPELARWYGCKGHGGPELDESKLNTIDPGEVPTPLGYGPSRKLRYAWTLSAWAQEPANGQAWKEIMEKHGVTHNPFDDIEAHFTFGDFAAWGPAFALSMNKARYFGWTGHVDTLESLHLAYTELSKIGMLPPPVADARPLI
ncbi:hypothetical protein LTR53_005624 [Teratosphaeriaceae sp. CCFEE 6253]|nr:hypothetical protein LTR53_005624 [Teratosphaeriaceae sp. CCFEE 6253]